MELSNARSLITRHEGQSLVIRFTKADGTFRRMTAIYYGHRSRTPETLVVWDMERGALRTVPLNRVCSIKRAGRELFATREADFSDLSYEEIHDLVATCF